MPTFRLHMSEANEEPSPVSVFLGLHLAEHSKLLKAAGYDDVTDFHNIGGEELSELSERLIANGMPLGHVRKLERLIKQTRTEDEEVRSAAAPAAQAQGAAGAVTPDNGEPIMPASGVHARLPSACI